MLFPGWRLLHPKHARVRWQSAIPAQYRQFAPFRNGGSGTQRRGRASRAGRGIRLSASLQRPLSCPAARSMAARNGHAVRFPSEPGPACRALSRTRRAGYAATGSAPGSFEHVVAFRRLSAQVSQGDLWHCRVRRAYRYKTRHDEYCR